MEFWSFCDSTSSRVYNKNELKRIDLLTVDVEIKRVAVVYSNAACTRLTNIFRLDIYPHRSCFSQTRANLNNPRYTGAIP